MPCEAWEVKRPWVVMAHRLLHSVLASQGMHHHRRQWLTQAQQVLPLGNGQPAFAWM